VYICAGLWETSPTPPLVYNVALMISPSGETLAAYRKIHLFDALAVRESDRMAPGAASPSVFTANGLKFGLAVCYDLRFPELFRVLSDQGADVILVPSAWYAGGMKESQWLTLLRARAIENVCYAAGAVLTGTPFSGRSAAFDPFGVPLADAGESERIVTFTAEKSRLDEIRLKLPALRHRRPDIFPAPAA
jgi:deaminated glutathione amidase